MGSLGGLNEIMCLVFVCCFPVFVNCLSVAYLRLLIYLFIFLTSTSTLQFSWFSKKSKQMLSQ